MLPDVLGALVLALVGLTGALPAPDAADLASPRAMAAMTLPSAAFRSAGRVVTNWRQQSALALDLPAVEAVRVFAGGEPNGTSRCVRLNNYWCIKRAGWSGEIAADGDGHVAFATADDGATVAALLLRRYYLVYGLRSALAIVSRWAPAQCGGPAAAASPQHGRFARPKSNVPKALATTLRGRFLASHTRGGRPIAGLTAPSMRRTIIADRSLAMMAAPEIAVGMGETLAVVAPRRAGSKLADLSSLTLGTPPGSRPPSAGATCVGEGRRIRTYASRAADGLVAGVDDDLKLFGADGTPGPNLARLMTNMAGVEIGPLSVRADLVREAISRAERQMTAPRAARAPPTGG